MSYLTVELEPIDPVLFGDNRMARAGEDHVLSPQAPSPFTIFGAVGQFIAKQCGVNDDLSNWYLARDILGELITRDSKNTNGAMELKAYALRSCESNFYFPAPLNFEVYKMGDSYYTLSLMKPEPLPKNGKCSSDFDKILVSKSHDDKVEEDFYIEQKVLATILQGTAPSPSSSVDIKLQNSFFKEEFRSGLKMVNKRNVTEEAHLFNRPYWRFISDYDYHQNVWKSAGITAWVKLKNTLNKQIENSIGFLGGDRRRALFHITNSDTIPFSEMISEVLNHVSGSTGFFAYLIAPLPILGKLSEIKLENKAPICAAIGKPQYISGWEKTKGKQNQHPRPLIWAAPAGSVLFYEWTENEKKDNELKKKVITENWLTSLTDNYYAAFGFGRIFIGVWKNGN